MRRSNIVYLSLLLLFLGPPGLWANGQDTLAAPKALNRPSHRLHYIAAARYYRQADSWLRHHGYTTRYFAAAAIVMSKRGVGMAGLDVPHLAMQGSTHRYLRTAAYTVLVHNARMLQALQHHTLTSDTAVLGLTAYLAVQEQYAVQRYLDGTPDSLRTSYLQQMNRAMAFGTRLKGKHHYLRQAQALAGTRLDFGSLYHRLLIAGALLRRLGHTSLTGEQLVQQAQQQAAAYAGP